jgi:transposase
MEGSWPDPDRLQQWIHEQGVPAGEVGSRLGLSRAAGYRWLQRYGIAATSAPVPQEQIVARWRAGTPADQLAIEYRLPIDAVRDRLVAAAAMTASRTYYVLGSSADPLPQDVLRGWYLHDRFSVSQIAALAGVTARQVRYRLARYRLSGGRPGPKPMLGRRLNQAMLTRLYDEGLTCAQIGERFGASAESIRALLAAYGIRRRTSGRRKRTAPAAPPPGMKKCPMSERAAEAIATARDRVAEARRLTAHARTLCQVAVDPDPGEQAPGPALVDRQAGLR